MNRKSAHIVILLLLAAPVFTISCIAQSPGGLNSVERPSHWAVPLQKEGLPNLHRVTDTLYRGAQPTASGMRELKEMGIRTVVNLRSMHSDRDEIGDTDLAYEPIPMQAWDPDVIEVVRFLRIATDKKRTPVFVHCHHGADRTGLVCAVYRIAVYGWTKEEAIREMTEGGFGFHRVFANLGRFIENLDIGEIRREAGIENDGPNQMADQEAKRGGMWNGENRESEGYRQRWIADLRL